MIRSLIVATTLVHSVNAATVGSDHVEVVMGHKIPDTDAICAAIGYAWELEQRGTPAKAYRLGELNPETEYVMKALDLETPPLYGDSIASGTAVSIVDTNNPDELPEGIHKAGVHSIVDHHKLSGLTSTAPLELDVRPLCSAGSILYSRAKAAGLTVPPKIAGCLLSTILSDSLEFRSPTTTELDKVHAAELAEIAGIDLHAHAEAMLDAKAQIAHLSPAAIVMMDSKVFKIGGKKLRISVVETTKPDYALGQKPALIEAQRAMVKEQSLDDVLLFVVDILQTKAIFVSSSDSGAALVERAWGVPLAADGTATLPGVLSRKKQIIPKLEEGAAKNGAGAQGGAADAEGAGGSSFPALIFLVLIGGGLFRLTSKPAAAPKAASKGK